MGLCLAHATGLPFMSPFAPAAWCRGRLTRPFFSIAAWTLLDASGFSIIHPLFRLSPVRIERSSSGGMLRSMRSSHPWAFSACFPPFYNFLISGATCCGANIPLDGGSFAALFDSVPSSAVVEAFRHHLFFLCWCQVRRFFLLVVASFRPVFSLPDLDASCPLAYPCTDVPYSCLCQLIIKSFQSVSRLSVSCFRAAVLCDGRPTFFLSARLQL